MKLYAETFIRKGAAIGNYLFIDSQDIAGIDKMPLRQCNNWILGRQREGHEVERVSEQIGRTQDRRRGDQVTSPRSLHRHPR